jgi:hypothetical protein
MKLPLSLILTSAVLFANTLKIDNNGANINMTIYNNNTAFIQDSRKTTFENEGLYKVIYEGVPKKIITDSVIPDFKMKSPVTLISQKFQFDTISMNRLLEINLGKEVLYKNGDNISSVRLVSLSPIMVQNQEGIISPVNKEKILFKDIPSYLSIKPSLVWNTIIDKKGFSEIELKYLTSGISWKSDYVINVLDNSVMKMTGFMTIKNTSGVSYENINVSCLAGSINRVNKRPPIVYKTRKSLTSMKSESISAESFDNFYLYKIPFKVSLKNNEVSQIPFFSEKIGFTQYGKAEINKFYGGEKEFKFDKIFEFKAKKQTPKGTVRVYKKDSSGFDHFIGEALISDKSKNEKITLNLGKYYDLRGKVFVKKIKNSGINEKIVERIDIKNYGNTKEKVKIFKTVPSNSKNFKFSTSCKNDKKCKLRKETAYKYVFEITVNPKERVTVENNYKRDF